MGSKQDELKVEYYMMMFHLESLSFLLKENILCVCVYVCVHAHMCSAWDVIMYSWQPLYH